MNINDLPPEVLCMIFDHLSLADVKNAALTCQSWKELIFASPYIKRFRLSVDIAKVTSRSWPANVARDSFAFELSKGDIYQRLLQSAFSGVRSYRHATFVVDDLVEPEMVVQIVWIIPLNTLRLRTLTLKAYEIPITILLPRVADVLPDMKDLESLRLECASTGFPEPELLKSDYIRQFEIILSSDPTVHHRRFIRLDMPNLRSYSGKLHILDESTSLDHLTDLTITEPCSIASFVNFEYYRQRLSRMPNLIELKIMFESSDDLFRAICQTCPSLEGLALTKHLKIRDIHTFADINQLAKLRRLELATIYAPNTGNLDLTPLNQLSQLVLNGTHMDDDAKVILPNSIRKVKLHIYGWVFLYRTDIMYRMCAEMRQLTDLHVVFQDQHDPHMLPRLLYVVRHMSTLERLTLTNGRVDGECFEMMRRLVPWLHTIRLVDCKIDDTERLGTGPEIRVRNCNNALMQPVENGWYRL